MRDLLEFIMLAVVLALVFCSISSYAETQTLRKIPKHFLLGAATSSYQVEGAPFMHGKGENIWDRLTHSDPSPIRDQSTGDDAADSYHHHKRDVEMMRELGLEAYRFSISWSRILPTGFPNSISEYGLHYYRSLIDEMLMYNITPIVTLYHWDLPQPLQDLGGFTNPLITDWFEDYARVVFDNFGDVVKHWITLNEPREICYSGYGVAAMAPAVNASGIGDYICAKNVVLAHARVFHLYKNDFKFSQGGVCGLATGVFWFGPLTDSPEDEIAAELSRQGNWALYTDPIFTKHGGWPKEFTEIVAAKSAELGYPRSRLPEFTDEEIDYVKGASDFFGINHYTTNLVSATANLEEYQVPSLNDDLGVGFIIPDEWPVSASPWLTLSPNSLFHALKHLNNRYEGDVDYFVTENGWSTREGLDDDDRVLYHRAALENVLDLLEEGVPLKGYLAWSLMDSFQWMEGYTERFGLYEVDFRSPTKPRTARKSAYVYKHIIRTRVIDHEYEPPLNRVMSIDKPRH